MANVILTVPDISCEHCEHTIKTTLVPVAGVRTVSVDIPAHQVSVDYDESATSVEAFKDLLREEDYPVESVTSVSA